MECVDVQQRGKQQREIERPGLRAALVPPVSPLADGLVPTGNRLFEAWPAAFAARQQPPQGTPDAACLATAHLLDECIGRVPGAGRVALAVVIEFDQQGPGKQVCRNGGWALGCTQAGPASTFFRGLGTARQREDGGVRENFFLEPCIAAHGLQQHLVHRVGAAGAQLPGPDLLHLAHQQCHQQVDEHQAQHHIENDVVHDFRLVLAFAVRQRR